MDRNETPCSVSLHESAGNFNFRELAEWAPSIGKNWVFHRVPSELQRHTAGEGAELGWKGDGMAPPWRDAGWKCTLWWRRFGKMETFQLSKHLHGSDHDGFYRNTGRTDHTLTRSHFLLLEQEVTINLSFKKGVQNIFLSFATFFPQSLGSSTK